MKKRTPLLLWLPCLLLLGGLVMAGCSATPVQVLMVNGPDSLQTSQSGTFNATINEKAKPPVLYQWDFADNRTGEGNPVSHAFDRPGIYNVTVTASNRKGKSSDTGQTAVVVYNPPVPAQVVTVLADPMSPDTRTQVRFGSNVRGDAPLTYAWSFGDGGSSSEAAPAHTYERPGPYTVTLKVSNRYGTDARTLSLNVVPYEASYCAELAEMSSALFDRNASVLTVEAEQSLRDNLDIMQDCPNLSVRVEGLAGPFERNPQRLSEDRARAVQQYYVDHGVAASRVTTLGKGRVSRGTKKSGNDLFQRADTIPLRSGM